MPAVRGQKDERLRCYDFDGPSSDGHVVIAVYPIGKYQHRQPLAYQPIRDACADGIVVVDRIELADIAVAAATADLNANGTWLRQVLRPHQAVVLLSEEPFWDSIWVRDPFTRTQMHPTEDGPLPLTVLNHHTSSIYDFERIPYFLLTDRSYCNRYALRFARNGTRDAAAWRAHFQGLTDIVFMTERRTQENYDVAFPEWAVFGTALVHTRIAEACEGPHVIRHGRGWPGHVIRRQELPDWHMDKLRSLDGRCRVLSAIENTHQANYITEKLFDAFAVGAVPLYIAGPEHRVHEIVPDGGWVNLFGLEPREAAARITEFTPDDAFLEAYASTQRRLAETFGNGYHLFRERTRLASALREELSVVMEMTRCGSERTSRQPQNTGISEHGAGAAPTTVEGRPIPYAP